MKWLLIVLALPLSSCIPWGTNCGDEYWKNYSEFIPGEYEFLEGDVPVWMDGNTLQLDIDRETMTMRLRTETRDSTYGYSN